MAAGCGGLRQASCLMLPVILVGSAPILLTDRAWTHMLPTTALCILCLVLPRRNEGGPPARLTCGAPTVQFAAHERIPASAGCAPLHSAAVPACLQTNPARLTCGAPNVRCAATLGHKCWMCTGACSCGWRTCAVQPCRTCRICVRRWPSSRRPGSTTWVRALSAKAFSAEKLALLHSALAKHGCLQLLGAAVAPQSTASYVL